MKIKTTYKGYIKGIFGIYCGFKPEGLDVTEEVPVYYPDKGKILIKNNEEYDCVVLQEGEKIEDYQEISKVEEE